MGSLKRKFQRPAWKTYPSLSKLALEPIHPHEAGSGTLPSPPKPHLRFPLSFLGPLGFVFRPFDFGLVSWKVFPEAPGFPIAVEPLLATMPTLSLLIGSTIVTIGGVGCDLIGILHLLQ